MKPIGWTSIARFLSSPFIRSYSCSISAVTVARAAKEAARAAAKSKMMRWGGVAIALFVIWHLFQFTWLKFNVGPEAAGHSVGLLVISSFQVWWVTLIYVLAMIALGLHLWHGVYSASQTLGFSTTAKARTRARATATIVALVTAVGFILPPLAILFGFVKGN